MRKPALRLQLATLLFLTLSSGASAQENLWTPWLNRDQPGGQGDYETLQDFLAAGQACPNPVDIQCQTGDGRNWKDAGQVYKCDVRTGGVCLNQDQPRGRSCLDYKVRFLCPRALPAPAAFRLGLMTSECGDSFEVFFEPSFVAGQAPRLWFVDELGVRVEPRPAPDDPKALILETSDGYITRLQNPASNPIWREAAHKKRRTKKETTSCPHPNPRPK